MKKQIISGIMALSLFISVAPISAIAASIVKEDLIITFKNKVDTTFLVSKGAKINRYYPTIKGVAISVPLASETAIKSNINIKSVEKVKTFKVETQIDDWGIANTKTRVANNLGYTGKGVKIAVLDTGIASHPDLFISGGVSFVGYTSSYSDDAGHGTHVAGIIGAKNNDIGYVGVAPDAEIYAVKVMSSNGSGTSDALISGIDWAISNHMNVINLSLGFGFSDPGQAIHDAIIRANNAGITVVSAAGNSGNATGTGDTVSYPAKYIESIAIAATDVNNAKASFSGAGPDVDVAAPGLYISSTSNTGGYVAMSGTSMATPYAAGVVALYREAYPNYTNTQIRALLEQNVTDLGTVGKDNIFGAGLIQSPTSLGTAIVPAAPSTPSGFTSSEFTTTSLKISWAATSTPTVFEVKKAGKLLYVGTNNSFTDTKLYAGTVYTYEVTARNVSGISAAASYTTATKATSLTAPTIKSMVPSDKTVVITLNPVKAAKTYTIKRGGIVVYAGESLTFTDTGLTPLQSYTYEITAKDYSNTVTSLATTKIIKTTPNKVVAVSETHDKTTVTLSWGEVSGVDGYIVKRGTTQIYKGPLLTFKSQNLLPGMTYTFGVSTYKLTALSLPTNITVQTIAVAPSIPVITGKTATKDAITLVWAKAYNVSTYAVQVDGVQKYSGTLGAYKITGLTPGQTYTITLIATNSVGSNQTTISVRTIPNPPSATSTLTANPDVIFANLSWTAVQDATYYVVKKDGIQIYKGASLQFKASTLTPSKSYNFDVYAGNLGGTSLLYSRVTKSTLAQRDSLIAANASATTLTRGTKATFSGSLKDSNATVLPYAPITISITKPGGVIQVVTVKTNATGNFTYVFYTSSTSLVGTYNFTFKAIGTATTSYKTSTSSTSLTIN